MKVVGFVIIIIGLIMVYVGITGSQHNLMAVVTGKTSVQPSGQPINVGSNNKTTSSTNNQGVTGDTVA